MSKQQKGGKPPADDDVLYLDADTASEEDSLEDILKEAQASAERRAQRQKDRAAEAPAAPAAPAADGGSEVVLEEIMEVVEEAAGDAAAVSDLELKLGEASAENERLQGEVRELRDALMRKQAEFENFRKRMQREKEDFERYAHGAILKEVLPVLDNLERALMVDSSADVQSLRQGVELVFRQLKDGLSRFGLKEVLSIGQEFDPNVHEAVASDSGSGLPNNTVVSELQKGYLHHDRLLRAAFVKVAMGGPATPREAAPGPAPEAGAAASAAPEVGGDGDGRAPHGA